MSPYCGDYESEFVFNSNPWISYYGTCFTTNKFWNVTSSGGLVRYDIKLNTSRGFSSDFSPLLGERHTHSGIYMVLHKNDHPVAALDNRGINLESGTSNRIILTTLDVMTLFVLQMCLDK